MDAVLSVAGGEKYLSPEIAQKIALLNSIKASHGLTRRERDVLRLITQGRTAQEIADVLGLTTRAVANQQRLVRQKLGAGTSIELLRTAAALGLID